MGLLLNTRKCFNGGLIKMLKEYTTKKIMELCEECGNDKNFMKKVWIPKEILKERKNKIIKWLEKEMHKSVKESKDFERNEVMEQHSLGIATGLALAVQKLKRL